jgi:hypothetical protein
VLVVVQAVAHSLSDWSTFDALDTSACGSGGATGVTAVGASVAPAEAVFVCVTAPLLPGLAIRTDTLTFDGDGWSAVADAVPAPVTPPSTPAAAFAAALFDWLTSPSVPGLFTRTAMFTFDGVS